MEKNIKSFSFKDKNGSLLVFRKNNILTAKFSDACSETMAKKFCEFCEQITPEFAGQPWGYLSASDKYYAATPDAEMRLIEGYKTSLENGCIAEAYCNKSAVGRAQIARIRSSAGIESAIESVCFDNTDDAEKHILSVLEKASNNRSGSS